jgi:hypothetical protein
VKAKRLTMRHLTPIGGRARPDRVFGRERAMPTTEQMRSG